MESTPFSDAFWRRRTLTGWSDAIRMSGGTDLLPWGRSPQRWGNLHPWDSKEENLNYNRAPANTVFTKTWPGAARLVAKMTPLVLLSNSLRTLQEERQEMKLDKCWIVAGEKDANTHCLLLFKRDFVWKNPLQRLIQSKVFIAPAQLTAGCFLCFPAQTSFCNRDRYIFLIHIGTYS